MTQTLRIDERKLKTIMAARGIDTYVALAKASGLHYTTISGMANGGTFRSETLEAIAKALTINPLDLLKTEGYPAPHMGAPAIVFAQ